MAEALPLANVVEKQQSHQPPFHDFRFMFYRLP